MFMTTNTPASPSNDKPEDKAKVEVLVVKADEKEKDSPKPEMIRKSSSLREGPIVQAKEGYYRILHARDWGKILVPSNNPDGADLTHFELNGIQLNPNFSKIPGDLWARYMELCFYMCPKTSKISNKFHDGQLEVQVCLLRDIATMTKWKIVVPKQVVSGVSVKAELAENIDIATGEKYTQFPPPGWVHAGSAHSHNTMGAFYSSIDDRSDSTVPGLHIVVGDIDHDTNDYTYIASVMIRRMRKEVNFDDVVDVVDDNYDFHEDVIDYIDTVVSANRKFLLKEEQKAKEEAEREKEREESGNVKITISPGFPPRAEIPDFVDENGNLTSFFNSLNFTNSDLFDEDSLFPFDDDIESIVNHTLDSGHSINDVIQSVVRAKLKREREALDDLSDDDDDDTGPLNLSDIGN